MSAIKIKIINNKVFDEYNNEFNLLIESVADEVFQTQDIGKIGYLTIGNYKKEAIKYSANPSNIYNELPLKKWKSLETVPENERILISHLLEGSYHTYILSGAMGSGKTSTANYLIDFIKNKINLEGGVFIKVNFNLNLLHANFSDEKEILARFQEQLYEKLKIQTRSYLLNSKDKIFRFIRYLDDIERLQDMYSSFFDFYDNARTVNWDSITKEEQSKFLFTYIEKFSEMQRRNELLMRFFAFLKSDLHEQEYFILLYDNLDGLPPYGQKVIFDVVRSLNEISSVKCLIPLRRATLLRVSNNDDGTRSSLSHGYFHHHGHDVANIINQRLLYSIKDLSNVRVTIMPKIFLDALLKRMIFLSEELSNEKSRIKEFINSLSGASIRLGLFMANRLLVNNVIRYDETPEDKSIYLKSLIIDRFTNELLDNSQEVFNLFNTEQNFSLLPLRIFQGFVILNETKQKVKKSELLLLIQSFKKWSNEDVIQCFNDLLLVRRPLMWSDTVNFFKSIEEISDTNGHFYLTEIGYNYFYSLLYNLTYVQECFMPLFWPGDYVPKYLDYFDNYERFASVIKCLKELYKLDKDEINSNPAWSKLIPDKISIDIITSMCSSITKILSNYQPSSKKLLLLDEMNSFITTILNDQSGYFRKLEDLFNEITLLAKETSNTLKAKY